MCYICRNFINLNIKDNLTYLVNKVINKKIPPPKCQTDGDIEEYS